jgi:hypothetical protein
MKRSCQPLLTGRPEREQTQAGTRSLSPGSGVQVAPIREIAFADIPLSPLTAGALGGFPKLQAGELTAKVGRQS